MTDIPHIAIDGMLLRRGVSGVETAIHGLGRALARYGRLRYTFFMPAGSPLAEVRGNGVDTCRCRIPFASKLLRNLHQQLILPRLLATRHCDLLCAPGYLAPKRVRVPVVLTLFDLIAFTHPGLCRRTTVVNYRLRIPGAVRRATRIVVPSEYTRAELLARFPGAAAKTVVLPLAVDEDFQPERRAGEGEAIRRRYGLPDRFVLFVGQIEPKKNVSGLLRAFCELRNLGWDRHHLVVAGNRGWEACDPFALGRSLGIADRLVLPGFIPRNDLPALYRSADLMVFPSWVEGFGLPPLEAMACGTPVIVSDGGALPEVVGAAAPRIPAGDDAALALAMKNLLGDRDELARRRQAGLAQAATFTWKRHVDSLEKVFSQALKREEMP